MIKIFIVGVGRSGTSLLHSIVGSHPNIISITENQLFRNIISKYNDDRLINNYLEFKLLLSENSNFDRLKISDKDLKIIYTKSLNYSHFYQNLLLYLKKDNLGVCEKDPRSIDLFEKLIKIDDKYKIIHIYRDPRSVISSRLKVKWVKIKSVIYHCVIYNLQLLLFFKKHDNFHENLHNVRYEDLVQKPEETITKICDFLNIKFSDEMLSFHKTSNNIVSEEEKDWKLETFKPIINYSKKYKENLTINQQIKVDLFTPIAFKKLKYKLTKHNLLLSFLINGINLIYKLTLPFYSFLIKKK
jgi:hypothetical protein